VTLALQECEGRLRGYGSEEMGLGRRRVRNWKRRERKESMRARLSYLCDLSIFTFSFRRHLRLISNLH
jgi:hypothetical protein